MSLSVVSSRPRIRSRSTSSISSPIIDGNCPQPGSSLNRRTASGPVGRLYSAMRSEPVAFEEAAGDHEPLDLVRALPDDHQRRVAVVALDRELGRVADPAVN